MSTIDYYNKNAALFSEGASSVDVTALYSHFLPKIEKKASILDLGCGNGRDSKYFKDAGYQVTSVDGSSELCRIAEGMIGQPVRNILFSELDYAEEFDAVWACASLLHVPKSEIHPILLKVSAALKPSGILYASFKYGNTERFSGERFYSDYSETDIPWLLDGTDLQCIEFWTSHDVRLDRSSDQWLNIICRKK